MVSPTNANKRRTLTNAAVLKVSQTTASQRQMLLTAMVNRHTRGNVGSAPRVKRARRPIPEIKMQLGRSRYQRAIRMKSKSFNDPVLLIQPHLGVKETNHAPSGGLSLPLWLYVTLRILAGGRPDDIALSTGIAPGYIYDGCVWPVIEAINICPEFNIQFPTDHNDQRAVAKGFEAKSQAGFDCCVGAIDGILIWTEKPTESECRKFNNLQSGSFFCGRKHKFGFNMQGICDVEGKFLEFWIDSTASSSDFLTFITSSLHTKMETEGFLARGLALFGDQAYVSNGYMVAPYRNAHSGPNDDFNFYQSQVRIRIEMAFGMLTRRWAILQTPLSCHFGIAQQIALVCACVRLHNFCIEKDRGDPIPLSLGRDQIAMMSVGCSVFSSDDDHGVEVNQSCRGVGHHTDDCHDDFVQARDRRNDVVRRRLRKMVADNGLRRPNQ